MITILYMKVVLEMFGVEKYDLKINYFNSTSIQGKGVL